MDFLNEIKERTIIVCPSTIKNRILNEINNSSNLINVKIYSIEDLKKNIYFDYDINAILYLMDEYNFSYDIANYYINNIYYIEDKTYNNKKLDYLVKLKKKLDDNNLLIYNKLFKNYYKNTKVLVFGYDFIDSFSKKILSNFNYEIIDREIYKRVNDVHKFNTLEDEVLYVINEIISLIEKGVSINKIHLLNLDSNYKDEIIRIFNMFKLPIDLDNTSSIISTIVGNDIFKKLKESKSIIDTVTYMDSLEIDHLLYVKIINIFNKYYDLDYSFDNILKCIKYDFENTILKTSTLKNSIKVGDLYNSYYGDDDYVFLLGFNQGSIPKVSKDEDYISDDLKEVLGLDSTNKLNKERIKATTNNINRIKNIIITYKKFYMKEEYYPSNLLTNESYKEVEHSTLSTENSLFYSKLKLAKMLDNLVNYDEKNEEVDKYFNSINDIDFMSYDNKYKKIDKELLHEYIKKCIKKSKNKYLSLSYTSMEEYFKCQFRYYVTRILNLNKYEDSFDLFIGNLFHYVLSKIDEIDFDFNKEYDYYLKNNDYIKSKQEYTSKEIFYIEKLKRELQIVCDFVKEFHDKSSFSKIETERPKEVDKSKDGIKIVFNGKIDKTMSLVESDKTLVTVIDYKTGNTDIDLKYAKEGIGLQLFMYLYLIYNSKIENANFVGFYLQNILDEIKSDSKSTYESLKKDSLKLNGYSTNNLDNLEKFDPTYISSNYIKSMSYSVKNNAFYKNAKIIDEDTIKNIIDFVDKKIDQARDNIINAEFNINPKYFYGDSELIGCKYCKYKDICFMKDKDIKYKSPNKAFDFLEEGDLND